MASSGRAKWVKYFSRGDVETKIQNKSGDVDLKIIGNKSGVNDIEAKQGLINYELKPK